jgi:integrase
MAQGGFVFKKGGSWFLRYRDNFVVDGVLVRKQKCVRLAAVCDRYRRKGDLDDLVSAQLSRVQASAKCPNSSDLFVSYVEKIFLPYMARTVKPSTYAGYLTYFERYIKPFAGNYALRDFTVAVVSNILESAAKTHTLNTDTVTKIRSILSAVFSYAMGKGHFPGTAASDNPASRALIPETATEPKRTVAATRQDVQGILTALKGKPLERAAVAILAFTGVRPGEGRGLRWEEWNRVEQHIAVRRSVWHREIGTTKTEQSERYVTVTGELREVLLDLWKEKGMPLQGYILAGKKGQPINLDNMAKREIVPALEKCSVCQVLKADHKTDGHAFEQDQNQPKWHGWYSLRRFLGTAVRMHSASSETTSKALGNSRAVADKHYIKPDAVLPDVRKAVNDALSGLVQ